MLKNLSTFLLSFVVLFSANQNIGEAVGRAPEVDSRQAAYVVEPEIKRLNGSNQTRNVYLKQYFAPYYFNNLTQNYGQNAHGSCGYVATEMLLSFWDTYWDDGVINENYECHSTLPVNHTILDVESPGCIRESESLYNVSDVSVYDSNITAYKNDYLHFLLLDFGKELFHKPKYDYGLDTPDFAPLFRKYIYDYQGYTSDQVDVLSFSGSSTYVRQKAIEYVKRGIPVKMGIGRTSGGGHSVVAYDYDNFNDKLYCHFGWGSSSIHKTIEEEHYTEYLDVVAYVFKNKHVHSDNYDYFNGNSVIHHCACETAIPAQIDGSFDYIDKAPEFKWNCLNHEKWFNGEEHYAVRLLRSSNYTVFRTINVGSNNSITLNADALTAIATNASSSGSFIIEVALYPTFSSSSPVDSYGRTCYLPSRYRSESNLFVKLSNPQKNGNKWTVTITNQTAIRISGQYNTKMCFFNDAKNWSSSLSDKASFTVNPFSSTNVDISVNWFADSIVASWVYGNSRYVTYADDLSSGSLKMYTNKIKA